MRKILALGILCGFTACAENRLHTYMLIQTPASRPGAAEPKRGAIELSPAPLRLTMVAPESDDLENLAEDLKLPSPSKYHRLPPLTFLRFEFENRTVLHWKLDLSTAYFTDAAGKTYRPVKAKDYAAQFTSVAYEHFKYDAMYASYITRHDNESPKEAFWFEKKAPHEAIELKRGDSGFQVLPFEFIPAGVENLVLHYPTDEKNSKQLKIHLSTERGS